MYGVYSQIIHTAPYLGTLFENANYVKQLRMPTTDNTQITILQTHGTITRYDVHSQRT